MAKVKNLIVDLQNGTTDKLYASWEFNEQTVTTSSKIKAGDKVSIKSGATYYNGVDVPDWVEAKQWIVKEVSDDRAVIDKSVDGENSIMSPINVKYLTVNGSDASTSKKTLDYYKVVWKYSTGDGVWFSGSTEQIKVKNSTYSIPSNAVKVRVYVKPIAKKRSVNGKDTAYWTGEYVNKTYVVSEGPPEQASKPEVSVSKYKLTASVIDIQDAKADKIEFYVVKGNSKFTSGIVSVKTQRAEFSCTLTAGGEYRVRCRAINIVGKSNVYGEWSLYSNEVTTVPPSVEKLKAKATTESSVKLTWEKATTAKSYDIEYTTNKAWFTSNPSGVTPGNSGTAHAEITGLDSGDEWFFRVRAVNDQGESGWSDIVSTIIGSTPAAPTTWSLTNTAIVGDKVNLYWVHNSEDGSYQTGAELEIYIDDKKTTVEVDDTTDEDEPEKTYSYPVDTSKYTAGTKLKWRVRTKGITGKYGDWSTKRTINVYAAPTLELHLGNDSGELKNFPFNITAKAGPSSQKPISYHVSVISEETYPTEDDTGSQVVINAGAELFSKAYNTSKTSLTVTLNPSNITLESGQPYKVVAVVAMNSGLTAEASGSFTVNWDDEVSDPDGVVTVDKETLVAYIAPVCKDSDDKLEDVTLDVYRREYDGSFTEIDTGLENNGYVSITDPHPSLDYARYRVVARSKSTSVMNYVDIPGYPVNEPSIVIQWDEQWVQYDFTEEDESELPPWTGSMVRIPYDVDISESNDKDVSLVGYIGREHPVSYYGTQKGEGGNWSCKIPSTDKETMFALRRLSKWMGDVYVREPSGIGYWATIAVNISQTHNELAIPVNFTIKRVEGDK